MTQLEQLPQLSGTPIEGGEAFVYFSTSEPQIVYKKYKTPRISTQASRLIEQNRFINALRPSDRARLTEAVTWPLALYGTEQKIEGCKMQKVSNHFYFSATVANVNKERITQLDYLIDTKWWSKPAVKSSGRIIVEMAARIEICYEYLLTLQSIWENNAFYGDVSPKNLLWTLSPYPRVMFLEGDSICITSDPNLEEIHTNGWFPNSQLKDLTSRDRSLGGLLVFRIIKEDLNTRPQAIDNYSGNQSSILKASRNLWQTGSSQHLDELIKALHSQRSQRLIRLALNRAIDKGHAIEVLRHQPSAPSAEEQEVINLAHKQITIEELLSHSTTTRRHALLRRRVPMPGFQFDITSPIEKQATKDTDLKRLVNELDFENAASQFLRKQKTFKLTSEIIRSLQHFLVQLEPAAIRQAKSVDESIEITWAWPLDTSINALIITGSLKNEISFRHVLLWDNFTNRAYIKPKLAKFIDHLSVQWALLIDDGCVITPSHFWTSLDDCQKSPDPQRFPTTPRDNILIHQRPQLSPQPLNYNFAQPQLTRVNLINQFQRTRVARLLKKFGLIIWKKIIRRYP